MPLARFLAAALACCAIAAALAQNPAWPTRPLKLIVADGPGSISDVRARQIGARLQESLGQPVVIENRPGGSMTIAAEAAARSAPDGYSLFLGNVVTHSLNPLLVKNLTYKPEDDFTPVTLLSAGPLFLVVHPSVPATTLDELVAYEKANRGKLNYGAIGQGSPGHVVMEQINALRGTRFVLVPYKSTAQYIQDLINGQLHLSLNYWPSLAGHIKAGKLRVLAVAGPRRLAVASDVPTFEEAGFPGIDGSSWQGIFVPAGTPRPIVRRLHEDLVKALQAPEIRNVILDGGSEVGGQPPDEFAAYVAADRARWKKAIADSGVTLE